MRLASVAALTVVAVASSAHATIWFFSASLDGLQEVPPNASPGIGSATATLNDVTGEVAITGGSFSGLISSANAAHIHGLAPPGVNAGVLIPLVVPAATSGTISGSGILTGANIAGMLADQTYINIHTGQFPGGEIRGQLILIPAPASLALLGFGGLLAARRRR